MLSPEESFLWICARRWRRPEEIEFPANLDWEYLARLVVSNRMPVLFERILAVHDSRAFPDAPREQIRASAARLAENAARFSAALQQFLELAAGAGIPCIVLKGLAISIQLYGHPAVRPGGDIDLLVPRESVPRTIELLEQIGIGAFWPNLLADEFYDRHHLHQQRSSPDLKTWFEIHWALDHPYTLLTVDYEELFRRGRPGRLLDRPVVEMTAPDLVMTLCIHLVKHAIYLRSILERPDLGRAILAEGMLMYYLDVAEALRMFTSQDDYEVLADLSNRSGASQSVGAVLRACLALLDVEAPESVLKLFPVPTDGWLTRRLMNGMVNRQLASLAGVPATSLWKILSITNGAFILRPIRLVESAVYFLPPSEYLIRRYGTSGLICRLGHLIAAVGQFIRFGWDSLYFAIERFRRLRAIRYSTSLLNRLEIEG